MHPELLDVLERASRLLLPDLHQRPADHRRDRARSCARSATPRRSSASRAPRSSATSAAARPKVLTRTLAGLDACIRHKLITGVATSVCQTNIDDLLQRVVAAGADRLAACTTPGTTRIARSAPNQSPELALTPEQVLQVRRFVVEMRDEAAARRSSTPTGTTRARRSARWPPASATTSTRGATSSRARSSSSRRRASTTSAICSTSSTTRPTSATSARLAAQTTRGCIVLERPDLVKALVEKHAARDTTHREAGAGLAELERDDAPAQPAQSRPRDPRRPLGLSLRQEALVLRLRRLQLDPGSRSACTCPSSAFRAPCRPSRRVRPRRTSRRPRRSAIRSRRSCAATSSATGRCRRCRSPSCASTPIASSPPPASTRRTATTSASSSATRRGATRWPTIPYERRLLLMPKCLRVEAKCPAPFDEFGLLCKKCGLCSIQDLQNEAERLGYAVLVAEGSAIVMAIIETGKIDAIVGVSCLSVLERAFPLHGSRGHPRHRDPAAAGRLHRHQRRHRLGVGRHPPDQRRQDLPARPGRHPPRGAGLVRRRRRSIA